MSIVRHLFASGSPSSPEVMIGLVDLIARACPQAQVVRLDGVGHMGPISHASVVAPHLAFQPRQRVITLSPESHCGIRINC